MHTKRTPVRIVAGVALTLAFSSAAPSFASAASSANCQDAGSRSLKVCVSQTTASRLTVGGGTVEDPYGFEQVRVTSYVVRVTNLDPRAVSDIGIYVNAAVAANCVSGCRGRLLDSVERSFGVVPGRHPSRRLVVPWRAKTTRADRTGRNYQVGGATITWNRRGRPHRFRTDNVCAGALKFGNVGRTFCDAP